MEAWHQTILNQCKEINKHNEIKINSIRNPLNREARMVATTETSGWRREGAATQSWMNTSRTWHRRREVSNWSDCTQTCCFGAKIRSKQRDFQSASARNMAFCLQTICSKPNPVNMLLFTWHHGPSTKPTQNPHQTHPKPMQNSPPSKGSWGFNRSIPGRWTSQPSTKPLASPACDGWFFCSSFLGCKKTFF